MHANWMCLYFVCLSPSLATPRNYRRAHTAADGPQNCCRATKYRSAHQNDPSKPPDFNPATLLSPVDVFSAHAVPCKLIPEIFMSTHLVLFEHNRIKPNQQRRRNEKNKQTRNTHMHSHRRRRHCGRKLFSITFHKKHIDVCFQLNCTEPFMQTVAHLHSDAHSRSISVCFFSAGFIHFWRSQLRMNGRKESRLIAFAHTHTHTKRLGKKYGHFVVFRVY